MTTGYIAWDDDLLRALLHGLMANIPEWPFQRRWIHGHQCTGCQHRVACICRPVGQRELLLCPWCTPWVMKWGEEPEIKRARRKIAKKKPTRRRVTRRPSPVMP